MVVWFAAIAAAASGGLADPAIIKALSRQYGVDFFIAHPGIAFISLSAIVLTITGAEALYADMGHFGRPPIRRAWFFVVFPALTLNYMGQGSLILDTPSAIDNPFFLLIPHWSRIPMVVLATVATVIASQAVISGAFSVTRQAVQLGFLPRLSIRHTSPARSVRSTPPRLTGCCSSPSSASCWASARPPSSLRPTDSRHRHDHGRHHPLPRRRQGAVAKAHRMVAAGALVFGTIDLAFLGANVPKIVHGAWFPLSIGLIVFVILNTWKRGAEAFRAAREAKEGPLGDFVREVRAMDPPVARVPGTAVYLNARRETTPLALRALFEHSRALHETVLIVSIQSTREPHVPVEERLAVDSLGYETTASAT